jgi:hypothetical protein
MILRTTITINENIEGLPKNNFDSLEELFQVLKEFSPLQLYHVDSDEFSPDVMVRIQYSKNNTNKKLTNFQG